MLKLTSRAAPLEWEAVWGIGVLRGLAALPALSGLQQQAGGARREQQDGGWLRDGLLDGGGKVRECEPAPDRNTVEVTAGARQHGVLCVNSEVYLRARRRAGIPGVKAKVCGDRITRGQEEGRISEIYLRNVDRLVGSEAAPNGDGGIHIAVGVGGDDGERGPGRRGVRIRGRRESKAARRVSKADTGRAENQS